MTNVAEPRVVPHASTRRSRRLSAIWIIPLVAVAIGAWLAWDTLSKEGPTIKISFESGEGLQAGQSQLKYKDIVFGTVKSLELSPDQTHVVMTVATTRQAEPLLIEGTIFGWSNRGCSPVTSPVSRRYFRGLISACCRRRRPAKANGNLSDARIPPSWERMSRDALFS
jgi:hypothetical protein